MREKSIVGEKRAMDQEELSKNEIAFYFVLWVLWSVLSSLYLYGYGLLVASGMALLPPICVWLLRSVFHLPFKKAVGLFAIVVIALVFLIYLILPFGIGN